MDERFADWLSFTVSRATSVTYANTVRSLFANQTITRASFESSMSLQSAVDKLVMQNDNTSSIYVQSIDSSESVADTGSNKETAAGFSTEGEAGVDRHQNTLRSSTISRTVYAINHYAHFLGYTYKGLTHTSKLLSRRSRNQSESELVTILLEVDTTLYILNGVTRCLRQRQNFIHAQINNFLVEHKQVAAGSGADSYSDIIERMYEFGRTELRQFLELVLRFFVLPLEPAAIRELCHYPTAIENPEELLLQSDFKSSKPGVFYWKSGQMGLAYIVQDTKKSSRRVATAQIPPDVAVYLFFYIEKCRATKVVNEPRYGFRIKRKKFATRLFVGGRQGGVWKHLVKDVELYCRRVGIDPKWLQCGRNYGYRTKLLWVVRQTYLKGAHVLDVDAFSHWMYITGISSALGQANSYYHAITSLHKLFGALSYFRRLHRTENGKSGGYDISPLSVKNGSYRLEVLKPVPVALYQYLGTAVLKYVQLFEDEAKEEKGEGAENEENGEKETPKLLGGVAVVVANNLGRAQLEYGEKGVISTTDLKEADTGRYMVLYNRWVSVKGAKGENQKKIATITPIFKTIAVDTSVLAGLDLVNNWYPEAIAVGRDKYVTPFPRGVKLRRGTSGAKPTNFSNFPDGVFISGNEADDTHTYTRLEMRFIYSLDQMDYFSDIYVRLTEALDPNKMQKIRVNYPASYLTQNGVRQRLTDARRPNANTAELTAFQTGPMSY